MGQRLKAESTSRVAASVLVGALTTRVLTLLKVPQLQVKSSESMPLLTDGNTGSFLGYDKSCMTLHSEEEPTLGTVLRGDVQKGLIKYSKREQEKGLVYL